MLLIVALVVAALAAISAVAVYSFGRFLDESLGPSGHALPPEPRATSVDRAVAPLTDAHPGATGMLLVEDNREAFAIRALATREAGRSLDLQYYIWHNDDTGGLLVREVLAAADRGVRVRVLLDDINARRKDRAILALDSHPRIEVRLFNPARNREGGWLRAVEMLLRAVSLNRRMHNKAWIADGRVAIVGGRNIGNEYFDAAEQVNFEDADLLLVGEAVGQASAIFDQFWNSRAVIPISALHARRGRRMLPEVRRYLDALAERADNSPWLRHLARAGILSTRLADPALLTWSADVRVESDPPEKAVPVRDKHEHDRWLVRSIVDLLAGTRDEAFLTSPYFVPGEDMAGRLAAQSRDGVDLRVLTNSLAATDVALVHAGYSRYRTRLLEGGVRIHELRPQHRVRLGLFGSRRASLHTKALVVDGRRGFVGSFNLDPRSVQLNTEMGVLFADVALAGRLRELFLRFTSAEASYRLELVDGDLRWVEGSKEGGRSWSRDPEAGFWRRFLVAVMRWLPIESQL
jgi:putative cardiolipin synthase